MNFNYSFPAVKGIQATREYYITMIPIKLLNKLFINEEEYISPEYRAQRCINESRIPEMKNYILNNLENYVFSALSASIDGQFVFKTSSLEGNIGVLEIDMGAVFLINDGQHRKAALEAALKERPEIGEETISIVFFKDEGLKRSQQMFADLNKHAVKSTMSLSTLYDDRDEFSNIVKSILSNNEFLNKYVDKDSFIDVMVAQSFVCNRDFVGNNNNLKAWRTTKVDESNPYSDGKLRFSLHDADFAFTDASYWNFLDPDIRNSYSNFKMFRKLFSNENFQRDFYNRAEELLESNLSYENACKVVDEMVSEVEPYKLNSNKRWGLYMWGYEVNKINKAGLDGWYYEIDYLKNFVKTRIEHDKELIEENGNENERNFLEAIIDSMKEY